MRYNRIVETQNKNMIYENYADFCEDSFRKDLESEYLENDLETSEDVKELIWSLAYEYGHSGGTAQLEYYYIDLAQVVNYTQNTE